MSGWVRESFVGMKRFFWAKGIRIGLGWVGAWVSCSECLGKIPMIVGCEDVNIYGYVNMVFGLLLTRQCCSL